MASADPKDHEKPATVPLGWSIKKEKFMLSPARVATVLTGDQKTFYGHRQLLFTGFCWGLVTRNRSSTHDRVLAKAAELIAFDQDSWIERSLDGRTNELPKRFIPLLKRAYLPLGGLVGLVSIFERSSSFGEELKIAAPHVRYVVEMATIAHYLTTVCNPVINPTVERLGKIAASLPMTEPSGKREGASLGSRQVWKKWSLYKPAIPLLYAARLTELKDGTKLLDRILADDVTLRVVSNSMESWFGMARYLTEEVFEPHFTKRRNSKGFWKLDTVGAVPAPTPKLDEATLARIAESQSH
jgi:hypothetical protein